MEHLKPKQKTEKKRLTHRCLALLMAVSTAAVLTLPDYDILPIVSSANEDIVMPLEESKDNNKLLASFDFSGGSLNDLSENGAVAKLVDAGSIISSDADHGNYLDLTNSDAYLSLDGSILSGLTELTVEMNVLTKDTDTNWAFFAAPNDASVGAAPTYLGILINDRVKIERFADGREHNDDFYGDWTANEWHKIRVVFAENSTALYIDDNAPIEKDSTKSLKDCLGENGIIWFGHASWGTGEGFNGYIDNISISGRIAVDPGDTDDEDADDHVVTEAAGDPDEEDTGDPMVTEVTDDENAVDPVITEAVPEDGYVELTGDVRSIDVAGDPAVTEVTLDAGGTEVNENAETGKAAADPGASVIAEAAADMLLVKLDFEDNNDGRLADKSGNNNNAAANGGNADTTDLFNSEGNNTFLDLTNKNAYLSLTNADGSGVLDNMAEVTVEMHLKTETANGAQWAFYAAPDNAPANSNKYLSVHLTNNTVVARRYDGSRPASTPNENGLSASWETGAWYTVKVVYEAGKTTLYTAKDGGQEVMVSAADLSANVWNCTVDVLWFGYSAYNEYFNGCIDDIKIWGTPRSYVTDNAESVESEHIITQSVIDPENTTVNMFDYWTFGAQNDQDYGLGYGKTAADLINNGINKDHLFLFDGSASFVGGDSGEFGLWNNYGGGYKPGESKWGIVQNTLSDGYPRLALDNGWAAPTNGTLSSLWADPGKRTESLDYLFDSSEFDGKAYYPDVTGLFRMDNDGYYYFRSQEVFAELNAEQAYDPAQPKQSTEKNRITLYDTPWKENYARGQFFPFNDWTELFYEVNGNVGQWGDQSVQITRQQPMNHWFGMSIETEFMQLAGGMINRVNRSVPMTFEFSGDDDVWIFIDDVLVADVGGIHNRIRITIDFSNGNIRYEKGLAYDGLSGVSFEDTRGQTTLKDMFSEVLDQDEFNALQWNGNTFADSTIHTLKFFYLERGNAASNCNIRFNLQEPIVDRIRKVDQNGDPLEGAVFELYAADVKDGVTIGSKWWQSTSDDFEGASGDPIITAASGNDGYALLATKKGEPLDLSDLSPSTYYILKETDAPDGFRKNPPVVLQYHDNTNTLTVVNKYEVGAYASFLTEWRNISDVCYADNTNGTYSKGSTLNGADLTAGLVIVVPVVKKGNEWHPMYGSNTLGWKTVEPDSTDEEDFIKALAEAALMQIADPDPKTQDWYLRWDGTQLKGQLENLPGDATRYVFNGGSDGDLMALFLTGDALKKLGLEDNSFADDDLRYEALSEELKGKSAKEIADLAAKLNDLSILYKDDIEKTSRTVIYIPNEQRELRVRKVNENGDPMKDTVFALFDSAEHAAAGTAVTSDGVKAFGTTGDNGELIFRANSGSKAGYAEMNWDGKDAQTVYWLKEIKAPTGYELNRNLIRIQVSDTGVYANATGYDPEKGEFLTGDADDGITVEASLGRLTQTLVKYAEGNVDETLKDIIITMQTADISNGALSWNGGEAESKNLTYKDDGYYPADAGEDDPMTFEAEDGYIRVMPRQTPKNNSIAKRDDLGSMDLDGLFSLINTVVVTDSPFTGGLTVSKTVEGKDGDLTKGFTFTVTLSDETISGKYGDMEFTDGKSTFTLKHDENKTAADLPAGITYNVEESGSEDYTVSKTGDTGEIENGKTALASFTNTRKTGSLKVSKTVAAGDTSKEFNFTVELSDTKINGTYDDITFTNGTAEFTLKDRETKTAAGLPTGIRYTVKEAADDNYIATSTGVIDTITEDEIKTAAFTNTYIPKGSLTVSKIVVGTGENNSDIDINAKFTFTVTLDDNTINGKYGDVTFKDGAATFELKHNEFKTIVGLPAGIKYTVTEAEADGYTESSENATGKIDSDKAAKAVFTNKRDTGSLEVSKTVTGTAGETDKDFTFTVTLSDTNISGTYSGVSFKDGKADLTLKHGESKAIEGLPAGITYIVAESGSEGYIVSKTGDEGTIRSGEKAAAEFTNHKDAPVPDTGSLIVSKTVTGTAGDKNEAFTFTVTLSDTSINGTYGNMDFTDGTATFTLKHGESVTSAGLPAGTAYTVTEAKAEGYIVTSTDATGTIAADAEAMVRFTNTKNAPAEPEKPDDPENPPAEPEKPTEPGNPPNPDYHPAPGNPTGTNDMSDYTEDMSAGTGLYAASEKIEAVITSYPGIIIIISVIAALLFILKKKKA